MVISEYLTTPWSEALVGPEKDFMARIQPAGLVFGTHALDKKVLMKIT